MYVELVCVCCVFASVVCLCLFLQVSFVLVLAFRAISLVDLISCMFYLSVELEVILIMFTKTKVSVDHWLMWQYMLPFSSLHLVGIEIGFGFTCRLISSRIEWFIPHWSAIARAAGMSFWLEAQAHCHWIVRRSNLTYIRTYIHDNLLQVVQSYKCFFYLYGMPVHNRIL